MSKRMWLRSVVAGAAAAALLAPASAQAQIKRVNAAEHRHSIGFNLGYVNVNGDLSDHTGLLTGRAAGDVLAEDYNTVLTFDIDEFNGFSFGGEYLFSISRYLEAGFDVGYYQKTAPSIYTEVTFDDGREIEQDLMLRVVPMTATVRFLPLGQGAFEPYVGAGIGIFNWHYKESGEFVDFTDQPPSIFVETELFQGSGTAFGPVVLAGVRAPIGGAWDIGGEIRWQKAEGDTSAAYEKQYLLGPKIDLGGWTTSFTMHMRF